jgi:hypothetical protein
MLLPTVEEVLRPLAMLDALDTLDRLHILDMLEPLEVEEYVSDDAVANLERGDIEDCVLSRWCR